MTPPKVDPRPLIDQAIADVFPDARNWVFAIETSSGRRIAYSAASAEFMGFVMGQLTDCLVASLQKKDGTR